VTFRAAHNGCVVRHSQAYAEVYGRCGSRGRAFGDRFGAMWYDYEA
jgi:hypothetical protein